MLLISAALCTNVICHQAAAKEEKSGASWIQFRGPNAQGIAANAQPPLEWSETNNIAWKVSLPWHGRSSPVVTGERIWFTTSTEQGAQPKRIGPGNMTVADHITLGAACFDSANGKCLWQVTMFERGRPDPTHEFNSWATPTPVIDGGRLYCDFGTYGTACLEAETGKILWKLQIPLNHQVGPGSSPFVYGNLLILIRDGLDAQFVMALDKNTGQTAWKTTRPPLTNIGDAGMRKAFSTPIIIESGGQTQLIAQAPQWIVALDPQSGSEIWRMRHSQGWSFGSVPLFSRDKLYLCTGCMVADLLALRVDGNSGEVSETRVAWRTKGQIPIMSTPVIADDLLYCVADNGTVSCFDPENGTLYWRKQITGIYPRPVLRTDSLCVCRGLGHEKHRRSGFSL